jgi:hypothetical protein
MTTTITRPDGSQHIHRAKPVCKITFPAAEVAVEVGTNAQGAMSLRFDHAYDIESFRNRYTGTHRFSVYGTRAELEAIHAAIGAALGL